MSTPESPTPRKPACQFAILEDPPSSGSHNGRKELRNQRPSEEDPIPLLTNKLGNKSPLVNRNSKEETDPIDSLLSRLTHQERIQKKGDTLLQQASTEKVMSDVEHEKVLQLRKELEDAKGKIAQMDQELSQNRITQHTIDQALGSPVEPNLQLKDATEKHLNKNSNSAATSQGVAYPHNDLAANASLASSPKYNAFQVQHNEELKPGHGKYSNNALINANWPGHNVQHWSKPENMAFGNPSSMTSAPQPYRPANNFRVDNVFDNNSAFLPTAGNVTNMGPFYGSYGSYPASISASPQFSPPMTPMTLQTMNLPQAPSPYQPRPVGTPLSPTAVEFGGCSFPANVWNNQSQSLDIGSGYMPPMEPMNYRRLLDRNMSCNWKYIVDKIVCSNDQQASIFLQQKLKVAPSEQKFELIEAIIAQAYPLMINRFGNFLVQRCFEHGTPEQVVAIANAIRGNTVNLSMDAFGCHVVQKAFDVVPEDYKAIMVHELLRRIPETVIHRYACHVWQKLFELRWSDSPPQIMKYVNEALRGMWHEVALGETGSLVVQNIFENCLEEDKRPCVNEVLASIDIVSHGQFGNWCIQHICEHGAPVDKSRAIEHVLRFASEYSTDQFASKVVEKCLKVGGSDFLERYLERVCEGRPDRPRMPLIDIAGDQYGNYLVQWVLIHAGPQHREVVANHVRKHMVSLRGSKFGSRVAMLCSNPAVATRPGPPMGMQTNTRMFSTTTPSRNLPGPPYR